MGEYASWSYDANHMTFVLANSIFINFKVSLKKHFKTHLALDSLALKGYIEINDQTIVLADQDNRKF